MKPEAQLRHDLANGKITPKFLKWEQVAAMLGVSKATLKLWRIRGVGPIPWKTGERCIKFTEQEVRMYLQRVVAGDPEITGGKPRWDPKTFQLLDPGGDEPAAEPAAEQESDPELDEAELSPEELAQWQALGIIGKGE